MLNYSNLNNNTITSIEKLNNDYTYFSIDSLKKDIGYRNPAYAREVDQRDHLDSHGSVESRDYYDLGQNTRNKILIKDIGIKLCCDSCPITVKTKTYSNYKKLCNMLYPYLVLFIMIFVLIFVFKVNIVLGNSEKNSLTD